MWPKAQQEFLDQALPRLKEDPRLLGVAVGGNKHNRDMAEFSDLDLVLVCRPEEYGSLLEEREALADSLACRAHGREWSGPFHEFRGHG